MDGSGRRRARINSFSFFTVNIEGWSACGLAFFYGKLYKKHLPVMLTNYLRGAWRSIKKNRLFSAINIFGLALGLAVCLLISLFVIDELGYDRYNENSGRIFRIVSDIQINGNAINSVFTPGPMGPALVKDHPGIETAVRVRPIQGGVLVRKGTDTWTETNAVLADPSLFDVFTLPLLEGDPHTALATPNSLVLSASLAMKYFNSTRVLGRVLGIQAIKAAVANPLDSLRTG